MPVTPEDVRRVAQLAGLHLTPDEETRLMQQIDQIIRHVDQLHDVDTEHVEPLTHPFAESSTPLRSDAAREGLPVEQALANAPDRHGPFFKVPRMIEEAQDD